MYDHAAAQRLRRATEEPLKLMAFGRTGPNKCFARYVGGWCVHIGPRPTCTCPDYTCRKNVCKHIMKTITRILGGSEEVAVQRELTDSQLKELFEPSHSGGKQRKGGTTGQGQRKKFDFKSPNWRGRKRKKMDGGQVDTKKHIDSYRTKYILEGPLSDVNKVADELLKPYTWSGANPYSPQRTEPTDIGDGKVRVEVSHCNSCE